MVWDDQGVLGVFVYREGVLKTASLSKVYCYLGSKHQRLLDNSLGLIHHVDVR